MLLLYRTIRCLLKLKPKPNVRLRRREKLECVDKL